MAARTIRDVMKAIQPDFAPAKTFLALPPESRHILQKFIDNQEDLLSEDHRSRVNTELRSFWDRLVAGSSLKTAVFAGVLKELGLSSLGYSRSLYWADTVALPLICTTGHSPSAIQDARDFLLSIMLSDDDFHTPEHKTKPLARLRLKLFDEYVRRTQTFESNQASLLSDDMQIARHIEDTLIAFGQKRPKDLFNNVDDLVIRADTRLPALTLLNAFLQHQTPHLYLVIHTPLIEHLLKCLMNDTSTPILSVALKSLIMLVPHIPGSLAPHLPRLFLVYSRILCWEKFSELSTDEQRSLVTDDRLAYDEAEEDLEDVIQTAGIDLTWDKACPGASEIEVGPPGLAMYFTYLYGLYPTNLMSYVRKPRRYLKDLDFPGADAFDLDQAVIRARTDHFRSMHLAHPNFYTLTIEEELNDPKWSKLDPADVVGLCRSFYIPPSAHLPKTLPLAAAPLPDVPLLSPLSPLRGPVNGRALNRLSPATSHASLRSGSSWLDTHSTAVPASRGASPLSHARSSPSDKVTSSHDQQPPTSTPAPDLAEKNLAHLQQTLVLLQNDLDFERWHKAQYSEHISQIIRRNVKEATVEAETLNLMNANRALKKQLEQVQRAREATIKDAALTRKQANSLEVIMTERFHKLKLEQETWQADADELRRLREEMKDYRELLVSTEARELTTSHQLRIAQREIGELEDAKIRLRKAETRLQEYEYREFEFTTTARQLEILLRQGPAMRSELSEQRSLSGVEHTSARPSQYPALDYNATTRAFGSMVSSTPARDPQSQRARAKSASRGH